MMPRSPASADGEYGKRREAERKDVVSLLVEKTGSLFLLRKKSKKCGECVDMAIRFRYIRFRAMSADKIPLGH